MVKKLAIIREIFKGDHNAAAARKLRRNQISALSGTLNYCLFLLQKCFASISEVEDNEQQRRIESLIKLKASTLKVSYSMKYL